MKKILLFLSILSITLNAQVVINEYSAANYDDIDFPGPGTNYDDWIELYNSSASSIDLSGYYLTDRLDNLQKWQIPVGTSIAAGSHLLFLADKKDGFANGNYHTNFKLTQTSGNEIIILSNPSNVILDSIRLNYPNKKNDSRCRITDGAATWGISKNPTEGSTNNNSKERYALTPTFDIPAGFYTVGATLTVTLSTTEPNSSIRYTLDGSKPNSSSTLYTNPISLSNTTVIRAKTYSTNNNISSSLVETNTYFINENHSTKVISISGGTGISTLLAGGYNEPEGTFELFETDGTFLAESTGEFNKHGNDSWAYDQRGLDYISRDQFGKKYAIIDKIFDNKSRTKFQRLILKCGASDNYPFEGQANSNFAGEYGGAHIRDAFINEMSQRAKLRLDERSNEFTVMYVNGNYWGVYDLREKVDDHDFTKYYYNQGRNDLQYLKTWGTTWSEYGGAQAQTDWDALVLFINNNDMTIPSNYAYVDSVFNTGSLIDYFILNGYVVVADWLNWNTGWWRGMNPNGDKKKWRYTLWDMDASFNHYTNYSGVPNQGASADPCDPEILGNLGGQGHVPIWNKLQTNDQFFADYINRYAELASTAFSCDSMHNLLNSMVAEIVPEMPAHIARWGGTMTEWQNNVDSIHAFIDARCANIDSMLVDCNPEISGPYDLTIIVQPPGSGEVQLSSLTPINYPYVGTYFGGVNITLDANAFQCFEFDHWTIANDTIFPTDTSENIFFTMSSNDTITVFFSPISCINDDTIYIDVQPPGSGTINIAGSNISSFPSTQYLTDSTNYTFDAIANTGFTFNNWDWQIHNPLPTTTSTNTIVYTFSNDTLTVNFNSNPVDTIVYIVQPTGAGNITVDGTNINVFPNTSIYPNASNSSLVANANAGFLFNHWEFINNIPLPNSTNSNITTTWNTNDTVVIHFDMVAVDTIVYIIDPVGAGTITVDGNNIAVFPNTSIYSQGSSSSLVANANAGFTFNNWEFNNNTALPNNINANITTTWVSNDSCIVHFNNIPTFDITYLINPTTGGNIDIDGVNTINFPITISYLSGTNVSLNANENTGFTFDFWQSLNSNLLPNITQNAVNFNVVANDTILANFNEFLTDTLWVITNPTGVAELHVASDIITSSPYMGIYELGELLPIEAIPSGTNIFNQWNISSVILPDYNANTFFTFLGQDTLFAYFNNVLALENIGADLSELKIYPTVVNDKITIEISANETTYLNIELLSIDGQTVQHLFDGNIHSQSIFKEDLTIDKIAQGIYFIKLSSEKTNVAYKIVKL